MRATFYFVQEFFLNKKPSLSKLQQKMNNTPTSIKLLLLWPPKSGKKREKILYGTTSFLRFYGAYFFCFFFPLSKKKKKGEICCYRRISVLTMLYDRVFVCWTHGQTPGLSGHHHNGYLLSFFFFCGEEDLLVGLKVNCIGAEQRKWGTHAKPCKPSDVHTTRAFFGVHGRDSTLIKLSAADPDESYEYI
jgi:hypothetical protein